MDQDQDQVLALDQVQVDRVSRLPTVSTVRARYLLSALDGWQLLIENRECAY